MDPTKDQQQQQDLSNELPQPPDSLNNALNGASNMLERLWKSHPWQTDVPIDAKPSLGPPPSAAPAKSSPTTTTMSSSMSSMSSSMSSMWSHPWKTAMGGSSTKEGGDKDDVKETKEGKDQDHEGNHHLGGVDSDELSLGEDAVLAKVMEEEAKERAEHEKSMSELAVEVAAVASEKKQWESQPVTPTMSTTSSTTATTTTTTTPTKPEASPSPAAVTPSPQSSASPSSSHRHSSHHQQPAMELLDIDFDNPDDATALKEAIGEEVLAMWEAQGLYQDLPEIRNEILKSVVDTKFEALREEQKQQREAGPPVLPSLGTSMSDMPIIAEEGEEEEESDEDDINKSNNTLNRSSHHKRASTSTMNNSNQRRNSSITVHKDGVVSVDPDAMFLEEVPRPTTVLTDEEIAERRSLVIEELDDIVGMMDTSEHVFVEAEGRLGTLPPEEVKISDPHAFNKYKLHDAVNRRVSKIFTGDHHVVEKTSFEDDLSDSEDENGDGSNKRKVPRQASMPDLMPSHSDEMKAEELSPADLRERLNTSFSAFDAIVMTKQQKARKQELEAVADDEWTEYEEVVEDEDIKEDLKQLAEDMDATLRQFNTSYMPPSLSSKEDAAGAAATMSPRPSTSAEDDEASFMELTVKEEETLVDESEEIDVDELSAKMERDAATRSIASDDAAKGTPPRTRLASKDVSYMEYTVDESADPTHRQSMVTKSGVIEAYNNRRRSTLSSGLGAAMDAAFPTITTTDVDDDEITQITFDHTVDGAASVTQDHVLASAYLNRETSSSKHTRNNNQRSGRSTSGKSSPSSRSGARVPPSPRKQSGSDSHNTDPTQQTFLMDESSLSQQRQGEASIASSNADSSKGAALNKSVAKILRVDIWSPKASVVSSAIERLCLAAKHGTAQRKNIARLGGVMAIVRAMQMHPTNVTIQVNACEALEHLSFDPDTQSATTEVGGMAAIVQAMHRHPDNLPVQAAACKALAPITAPNRHGGQAATTGMSDSDDEEDPRDGVVQTLVKAMTQFPKDACIQAKSFGALANLCLDNQERLQELSDSGGLTAMTLALQRPWKSKTDQHEAISTLSILLRSLAELDNSQHSC